MSPQPYRDPGPVTSRVPPRGHQLANLLERDRLFTESLAREANEFGLRVIDVRAQMTEDDLAAQVAGALGI